MAEAKHTSNGRSKADYRTVAEFAAAKRLDPAWLIELGVEDAEGGGFIILYFGEDGNLLYKRERGTATCRRMGVRFYHPKGTDLRLYGLDRLDACRRAGRAWLGEGESDVLALWAAGEPALGLPGAEAVTAIRKEDLEGIPDLVLTPDNDEAGARMTDAVATRLAALNWQGRLWRVRVPEGFKDVSDWRTADPEHFPEALRAAWLYQERIPLPAGRKQEHGIPRYEPFPLAALPPVLREYADAAASAIGCDPALVALPALAVVAGCIGNSRVIQLRRKWSEPAVLWAITVARSGGVKSAGFAAAVDHCTSIR